MLPHDLEFLPSDLDTHVVGELGHGSARLRHTPRRAPARLALARAPLLLRPPAPAARGGLRAPLGGGVGRETREMAGEGPLHLPLSPHFGAL